MSHEHEDIAIQQARHRLEVLLADTNPTYNHPSRSITAHERYSIRAILDELHRLNLAVSQQRKTLQSIADRRKSAEAREGGKNKASRKPSAARSTQPTAHGIRQKKGSHRS